MPTAPPEHVPADAKTPHRSGNGRASSTGSASPGWSYNAPSNDEYVLAYGHAGYLVAYWSEGCWWEAWSGDKLDRSNVKPWAWKPLPTDAPARRG